MIDWSRNMMVALSLITVVGCSFHSAQWEGVKALWIKNTSGNQPTRETYWWSMTHEGESYRLFPVAWNDRTVLTDGNRWVITLKNSDILMIRDLLESHQVLFEDSVSLLDSQVCETSGRDSPCPGRQLNSEFSDYLTEVSIVEGPIGKSLEVAKTSILCRPPRYYPQAMRRVTRCAFGAQEETFKAEVFDHFGNVDGLRVSTPSNKTWAIYRSNDLVDASEIKRYLEEHANEF